MPCSWNIRAQKMLPNLNSILRLIFWRAALAEKLTRIRPGSNLTRKVCRYLRFRQSFGTSPHYQAYSNFEWRNCRNWTTDSNAYARDSFATWNPFRIPVLTFPLPLKRRSATSKGFLRQIKFWFSPDCHRRLINRVSTLRKMPLWKSAARVIFHLQRTGESFLDFAWLFIVSLHELKNAEVTLFEIFCLRHVVSYSFSICIFFESKNPSMLLIQNHNIFQLTEICP